MFIIAAMALAYHGITGKDHLFSVYKKHLDEHDDPLQNMESIDTKMLELLQGNLHYRLSPWVDKMISDSLVKSKVNSPAELLEGMQDAFKHLEQYCTNLVLYPWKKHFHKIRV